MLLYILLRDPRPWPLNCGNGISGPYLRDKGTKYSAVTEETPPPPACNIPPIILPITEES